MSEKSEPTAESTALRQERDMLLQFFHVSPVAQFVKDRSGRYVMVNARFATRSSTSTASAGSGSPR